MMRGVGCPCSKGRSRWEVWIRWRMMMSCSRCRVVVVGGG